MALPPNKGTELNAPIIPTTPLSWFLLFGSAALGVATILFGLRPESTSGRIVFAGQGFRYLFVLIGLVVTIQAARGVGRVLRGEPARLDSATRRRARIGGAIFTVVGAFFFCTAIISPLGDVTVGFSGWAKPVYATMGGIFLMTGLLAQWNPSTAAARTRLHQGQGTIGTARIVRASDTGLLINDRPQVMIELEVELPDGLPYPTTTKVVMEQAKLALLIPGSTLSVRADVLDPTIVSLDWDTWKGPT